MDFPPMVRKRMVELSQQGMEVWEIVEVFGASESGVRRVLQRYRERGTHLPLPRNPGRKLQMTESIAGQLRSFVAEHADATRQEIKDALRLTVSRVGPAVPDGKTRRPAQPDLHDVARLRFDCR